MSLKALVFDFDGIITDTEPVHMEAWQSVLEPLGVSIDEEEFKTQYVGLNDRDFLTAVAKNHQHHFDEGEKHDLIELKSAATIELLQKEIPLLPGVREFIEGAKGSRMMAICSGANRGEIEFILRHLGWTDTFDPIIASESVERGKPDPEGYIRAVEGLNEKSGSVVLAEEALAIEDSPKGIAAAKAAGLKCLAVRNSFSPSDLSEADWIVDSLADVALEKLS